MKFFIAFSLILLLVSCDQSWKLKTPEVGEDEMREMQSIDRLKNGYFKIMPNKEPFSLEVVENIEGSNRINHWGNGYHLIIGKTLDSINPIRISVLYNRDKPYTFKRNDKIKIFPHHNQNNEKDGFGLMYMTGNRVIDGKIIEDHVLGSENLSIWAEKIEKSK